MSQTYASLHNHDYYSIMDGYSSPKEMLEQCVDAGVSAFATTNHGHLYSYVYYDSLLTKLKKENPERYGNLKLIFGNEMYECDDINIKDDNNRYYHLVVLIRDEEGRKIMNELTTKSNFEGMYYKPRVDLKMFEGYGEHFVVSSACLASKLSRTEDYQQCLKYVEEYKKVFPYFYLEMQSHDNEMQMEYNRKILRLAEDTNTPCIITTDSHYARKEDAMAQSYWVSVGRKQKGNNAKDMIEMSEAYDGCYIQSVEEIHEIMDKHIGKENVDKCLQATLNIADMIEEVHMPFQDPQLPPFDVPEGFKNEDDYLWYQIKQGWKYREFNKLDEETKKVYLDRVKYEYDVITKMNFGGYFLHEQSMTDHAHDANMAIGAGRGSAAGSLICYLLRITNMNPMKYGLIFERFLNPERISLPDVDTDFGDRSQIVGYMTNKYGANRVCQIANFNYETPLTAIQNAGRILEVPIKEVKKVGEYFKQKTFEECLENTPDIYDKFPSYKEMIRIASLFSGRVRGVGAHAGGLCICPTDLRDYYSCKPNNDGEYVLEVDKKFVEAIGLVKYDALGVETLNVVKEAVESAGITLWDIDINNPEFENDKASYDLICSCNTEAVFQFESAGMKALLKRIQPRNLHELADANALIRPDAAESIEPYIAGKYNPNAIEYIHPDLEPLLKGTNGQMIYQEQLMDIVRTFGGRSYGGADIYRKAIGELFLPM